MKVRNIILDVDGTLWNTTEVVAEAWNRAIVEEGHSNTRVDASKLQSLFGKTMDVIADNLFQDVSEEIKKKLLVKCCEYEQRALKEQTLDILYPAVKETLLTLSEEKQIRLFIVSNCQSGYIELFLEKNQMESYIQDKECFGNTGKGKGENIKLLLQRNGLQRNETIYVGDTQGDKEASDEAGIAFVYASYGFGSVEAYDAKIASFSDLISFVETNEANHYLLY